MFENVYLSLARNVIYHFHEELSNVNCRALTLIGQIIHLYIDEQNFCDTLQHFNYFSKSGNGV